MPIKPIPLLEACSGLAVVALSPEESAATAGADIMFIAAPESRIQQEAAIIPTNIRLEPLNPARRMARPRHMVPNTAVKLKINPNILCHPSVIDCQIE
jgi:hypothetical protein